MVSKVMTTSPIGHDHPFPFPEEGGELLRRRLCMVMATPSPFLEGVITSFGRNEESDHDQEKELVAMVRPLPLLGKDEMVIIATPSLSQKRKESF